MRFSPSTFTTGMCCLILMVTNLKDELKQKLPQWYKDRENQYGLILTDDIDSLLSCAILKAKMNWDIEQVMLFNAKQNSEISVDWHGVADNATHEAIGVDFARVDGKLLTIMSVCSIQTILITMKQLISIISTGSTETPIQKNTTYPRHCYYGVFTISRRTTCRMN